MENKSSCCDIPTMDRVYCVWCGAKLSGKHHSYFDCVIRLRELCQTLLDALKEIGVMAEVADQKVEEVVAMLEKIKDG